MANRDAENLRKGPWLEEEDLRLTTIVEALGERHWDALAKKSGLRRSGKSCRLRWMNYLRPNLKHGEITHDEEHTILHLHRQWGNKWARIARRLPGRTDNEIKNYWRSHLKKKSEAQHFEDTMNDTEQDPLTPKSDNGPDHNNGENHMNGKDAISGASSLEASEPSSIINLFGSGRSPYESRISDWMSCCWPHVEDEQTDEVRHHEDCMAGTYPCFCRIGSSSEESERDSVWDLWSPIWDMS